MDEDKESKVEEEVKETNEKIKPKPKGISFGAKEAKEMKRLGAKGLSIKNNQIIYNIPPEIQAQRDKKFQKLKKKRKETKKAKRKNRRK